MQASHCPPVQVAGQLRARKPTHWIELGSGRNEGAKESVHREFGPLMAISEDCIGAMRCGKDAEWKAAMVELIMVYEARVERDPVQVTLERARSGRPCRQGLAENAPQAILALEAVSQSEVTRSR